MSLNKIFFVPDKNFCPRLKSSYLLGKRIENYFKLWKTFFPWLKSYFPSISQAKMYFFSLGQSFLSGTKVILSGTKIILSGQMDRAYVDFLLYKIVRLFHGSGNIPMSKTSWFLSSCYKMQFNIFPCNHYASQSNSHKLGCFSLSLCL